MFYPSLMWCCFKELYSVAFCYILHCRLIASHAGHVQQQDTNVYNYKLRSVWKLSWNCYFFLALLNVLRDAYLFFSDFSNSVLYIQTAFTPCLLFLCNFQCCCFFLNETDCKYWGWDIVQCWKLSTNWGLTKRYELDLLCNLS